MDRTNIGQRTYENARAYFEAKDMKYWWMRDRPDQIFFVITILGKSLV